MPAIQAAREASRRATCVNNLAQLGIALQNYTNAYEVLPPGTVNPTGPIMSIPKGYHYSWVAQLLPYIEETNTFTAIDFKKSVYDEANDPPRRVEIFLLECPSDPTAFDNEQQYWISCYAGCHHDVEAPIDADNHGVFFLNSAIRDRDITDGKSHTIFLGEHIASEEPENAPVPPPQIPTLGWMSGTRGTLRNTGWLLDGTPDPDSKNPYCQPEGKGAEVAAEPMMGHTGDEPGMGMMMGPGPVVEPRVLETILADYETWEQAAPKAAQRDALRVGGFSSGHPGVVNFLFGDGSVRSLSKLTDASLLQQFAHRADGKLLYESQDE